MHGRLPKRGVAAAAAATRQQPGAEVKTQPHNPDPKISRCDVSGMKLMRELVTYSQTLDNRTNTFEICNI